MKVLVVLTGPTSSGKSKICDVLAENPLCRIINCDSKQIYSGVPTITDQPTKTGSQYRLYGYVSPNVPYSVKSWLDDAEKEIKNAFVEGYFPIVTGGSGMYINSLLYGLSELPDIIDSVRLKARELLLTVGNDKFYDILLERDPNAHRLHKNNTYQILRAFETIEQTGISIFAWKNSQRKRIFENFKVCALLPPREELYKKINSRFLDMMGSSAISEVEYLMSLNIPNHMPIMKAHGVPEIVQYLAGKLSLAEAISIAQTKTRQYAKRQYTWMRSQLPSDTLFFRDNTEAASYISSHLP